jgi:hypothetical protein
MHESQDIKKKLKNYKTYFTINNSFLIYINKDVFIYKKDNDINSDNSLSFYTSLVKYFNPEKIFIGKSPKIKLPNYDLHFGKKLDGNTILLKLKNNNYIFIGDNTIEKFTTPNNDKILKYYSFIVDNDTPLPLAIGQKYIYFFNYLEGYLSKSEFSNINNIENIITEGIELDPFLFSIKTHKPKNNKISLEKFKEIQNLTLEEIKTNELKIIANIYGVTISGTKKEIADRIENMRKIKIYKK